ncbi:electron transfer flavoprotein subunit alpha/FixB family protein [Thermomicrobium sp. 4228-Ro]|uniref:electron transfer flavoprotein subunit alpha/FixB family protein n=1 Tax=Thermomicrobium sp. 4228-Ro TaxID=2993937 RepID=UPI002248CB29|nr:electron transfer flavoprotein subunit alpha/FixB family protein [Thermomicrobium sp. 4228-Ro]MCX2726780.1 electron transfer flavoprotein subunit alpha/FixB family protein [Thermomicrobium sp. 4228-Ro]
MGQRIVVLVEHLAGEATDVTYELLGLARRIANADGAVVEAVVLGEAVGHLAERLPADRVLLLEHPSLHFLAPEPAARALAHVLGSTPPRLTIVPNTSLGMDVAAWVATRLGWPLISYCRALEHRDGRWVATAQLFGGKILADVPLGDEPSVVAILAGAFSADAVEPGSPGTIERVAAPAELEQLRSRVVALERPEAADVDITRAEKIVAVGRGIESKDNVELAEQLAQALGAVLAASRPLVDAGWLPRSRQVGKSGLKVKPKLYMALGISGAPEHLEGMKDAELIIAVNKDPKAPIFTVADYGAVADLFDVAEALLERLEG